jgi:excisionase family DNA binding protein
MTTDDKLTAQETADALGYHVNHVYRLLKLGAIEGTLLQGKVWLIDREEVNRVRALQDEHGRYWHGKTAR